jgi:hypothetical protein
MEVLGGLVLSVFLLVLLAGIGITTLAAFGIMTALGLLTDISFKRIFFMSFAMGLLAPLLVAGATWSVIEDGSIERGLSEIAYAPDEATGEWSDIGTKLEEIERDAEQGDLTDAEIEARIEAVIADATGLQLDLQGVVTDANGEDLRIKAD